MIHFRNFNLFYVKATLRALSLLSIINITLNQIRNSEIFLKIYHIYKSINLEKYLKLTFFVNTSGTLCSSTRLRCISRRTFCEG